MGNLVELQTSWIKQDGVGSWAALLIIARESRRAKGPILYEKWQSRYHYGHDDVMYVLERPHFAFIMSPEHFDWKLSPFTKEPMEMDLFSYPLAQKR